MKKYIFKLFIFLFFLPVFSFAQQTVDLFSEAQRGEVRGVSSQDFLSRVSNDYRLVALNDVDYSNVRSFEFNLFGNNQLLGAFYEKNVFTSYGAYWEHPFLFSDKVGLGLTIKM